MGVHRLQSLAGMYFRREKEFQDDPSHLLVPIPTEKHDACYSNLPLLLKNMEKNKTVDLITIYNRDLSFRYTKDIRTDEIKSTIKDEQIEPMQALLISRDSFKENPQQIRIVKDNLEMARNLMLHRNDTTKKLRVVENLQAELQKYLAQDKKLPISTRGGR